MFCDIKNYHNSNQLYIRDLHNNLIEWKKKNNRKPLIIRGARQVGKTTLVHSFSTTYKYRILLNLEKKADVNFFDDFDDVKRLTEALCLQHNISITSLSDALLFIDEIQESPKAIQMLRYFYEELPELHLIAAGSLLEFALADVKNFPVGRIEFLYLHPLNFLEYLEMSGLMLSVNYLKDAPVENVAHKALISQFHEYAIIGGMPEVVDNYLKNKTLTELPMVYESIWGTYKNDIKKYGSNDTMRRVIEIVINSAHLYIDQRIKFQNFAQSNYRSREVSEAMRLLHAANVIRLVYPTTDCQIPLKTNLKKSPKIQLLDTGLVNYNLNIQAQMLALEDLSHAFKGAIIPHLITQEVISMNTINNPTPNFWVREKSQSSAEVDLLIPYNNLAIPLEIKSGPVGKLRSLHQFMNICDHHYSIRMSANTFSIDDVKTNEGKKFKLMNLPYYLGTQLFKYIDYFTSNY